MWRPLFSNRYLASATVPLIRFLWNSACEFFIGIVEQVWVLLSQPSGSYTPLGHKWICVHMLFCMGVKLGRWHCRRKGSWGCLRKWCWGEYLDQGGTRLTGEWKRLHNEELNDLYSSPNIVQVIKWRRMRWAGHVAHMGEERGVYRFLVGKPEGRNHWGDLGIDGWIILGWISRRWDVGIWTGLGWPRIETGGGRLWVR